MLFLQTPPPNVKTAIDRIVAAHVKMTAFEARVTRPGVPVSTLARSASGVWFRTTDTTGLFPSVRTVCAKPTRGWVYDGFLAEIIGAKPTGATPFQRLATVMGAPDQALQLLLEPAILATYLRNLSRTPGTKLVGSTITFPVKGNLTRVTFDPVTRRVRRFTASGGGTRTASGKVSSGTDVRYEYGTFGLTGFAPASARPVVRPTVLSATTTFDGVAPRRALGRMLERNARLMRANVAVETDDATYRILAYDGKVRQVGPRLDIGYDGRTLQIVDRRAGKTYRGAAKRSAVRAIAAKLGEPLLPLAGAFLTRSLPFAGVLFPPRRVSIGATMPDRGGETQILKLSAKGSRASVFVRSDGIVTSLESEESDAKGTMVAQARQRYVYTTTVGNPGLPTVVGTISSLPKI